MRTSSVAAGLCSVMLVGLAVPRAALGQTPARDPATAQALFEDGKQLFQAGKYASACPKLAESQRLDPAGGTLLLLAMCHEADGKTATAWAEFDEAASAARQDRRADREAAATEHQRALEARLTRVTISVAADVPGLEIYRDDVLLGKAQLGTALPIDPGVHTLRARAPGKKDWSGSLPVPAEAKSFAVTIPALEDAPAAKPVPPPAAAPAPTPHGDVQEDRSDPGSTQRVIALVVGGAGVVAAGVGVGFGLSASSKWKDAEKACPNQRCQNDAGMKTASDAGRAADFSTGFFVASGVLVAGAAVLYFTAPSAPKTSETARVRVSPLLGPGAAGVAVAGSL